MKTLSPARLTAFLLFCLSAASSAHAQQALPPSPAPQLKVFLDCQECFQDFLRTEITFVDYVRDRTEASVHVLITSAETGSGGREYTLAFIGLPPFEGTDHTLKAVTTSSDPDDVVRRQLATAVRIGLLNYVAGPGVPQQLDVSVDLGSEDQRPAVTGDRWNNWVFSLRGSASFEGEESSRERQISGEVSADRCTRSL